MSSLPSPLSQLPIFLLVGWTQTQWESPRETHIVKLQRELMHLGGSILAPGIALYLRSVIQQQIRKIMRAGVRERNQKKKERERDFSQCSQCHTSLIFFNPLANPFRSIRLLSLYTARPREAGWLVWAISGKAKVNLIVESMAPPSAFPFCPSVL